MWKKVKSIEGRKSYNIYPLQNIPMNDNQTKVTTFLNSMFMQEEDHSSEDVVDAVVDSIERSVTYETKEIYMHELERAFKKLKNTSPREDNIMNIFLKKLPMGMR